jgi:hypothetical protein
LHGQRGARVPVQFDRQRGGQHAGAGISHKWPFIFGGWWLFQDATATNMLEA